MISRETENVKSSEEIESAFRALSAENKPFVTKEELYQVHNTHTVFPLSALTNLCMKQFLVFEIKYSVVSYLSTELVQGTSRLLHFPHEALPGRQGSRNPIGIRLRGIHPLIICQLIPHPLACQ